jgi:hypothetical protein
VALLQSPIAFRNDHLNKILQQSLYLLSIMSQGVAEAESIHNDGGEESSIQLPPASQGIAPIVQNAPDLVTPTRKLPHSQLSSGPQEVWVPYYIHTAKCDRCGQHNTSVIQRSSRENKQFCKPCMHLNVSDRIYTANVEGLDWVPQTASVKRTTKPRKPKQPKKVLAATPTLTRVSKRKRKEPKTTANKRIWLSEQPERQSRCEDSLFVAEDEGGDEGEETDDDVGFGRLPPGSRFPSEGQEATSAEAIAAEIGEHSENRVKQETESTSVCDINKPECPPWWEQTQAPESNVRAEPRENLWDSNAQSSLIERRRSEFSPDAVAAADILMMFHGSA